MPFSIVGCYCHGVGRDCEQKDQSNQQSIGSIGDVKTLHLEILKRNEFRKRKCPMNHRNPTRERGTCEEDHRLRAIAVAAFQSRECSNQRLRNGNESMRIQIAIDKGTCRFFNNRSWLVC
jgi:hypothetical protein